MNLKKERRCLWIFIFFCLIVLVCLNVILFKDFERDDFFELHFETSAQAKYVSAIFLESCKAEKISQHKMQELLFNSSDVFYAGNELGFFAKIDGKFYLVESPPRFIKKPSIESQRISKTRKLILFKQKKDKEILLKIINFFE